MNTFYKIYLTVLEEKQIPNVLAGYSNTRAIHCPDFLTEQEAESWLKDELQKQ